jgi:phosphonate transport system substrate-binding protein
MPATSRPETCRRRCRCQWLLGVFWVLLATTGLAQETKPIRLGIMPFNSALALIKAHQPLRQHLENALNRKVEIFTSADYYTFVNELLDGSYDLAIAGPHFGSMAADRGWLPLVRYQVDLQPVFVVANNSPITKLSDLRGKRIGLSSRLSISSIGGVKWLNDQGLKMGVDYQLFERTTHGAAVAAVAVGELDAALTTYTPLKQIPEDIQAKVRILPLDVRVPHLMTLANKKLGERTIGQIRTALQTFPASEGGRAFFQSTGYEGYRTISAKDMADLTPYVSLTVQMMKSSQ